MKIEKIFNGCLSNWKVIFIVSIGITSCIGLIAMGFVINQSESDNLTIQPTDGILLFAFLISTKITWPNKKTAT